MNFDTLLTITVVIAVLCVSLSLACLIATIAPRLLMWLVWNVPLGPLAPWIFGLAIGSKPVKVEDEACETPPDVL